MNTIEHLDVLTENIATDISKDIRLDVLIENIATKLFSSFTSIRMRVLTPLQQESTVKRMKLYFYI